MIIYIATLKTGLAIKNIYVNVTDLESNDSYGTLGLDQETTSPPPSHNRYLHGGSSTPPYLSSPTHHPMPYSGETYSALGGGMKRKKKTLYFYKKKRIWDHPRSFYLTLSATYPLNDNIKHTRTVQKKNKNEFEKRKTLHQEKKECFHFVKLMF